MAYDPRNVVSHGFPFDDFMFTYKISGTVVQDDLGKALTIDTTAENTFKLAGDNAPIQGRLFSYEDRSMQGAGKTGTVQRKFKEKLKAVASHGIAVGDFVVGSATAGLVKKGTALSYAANTSTGVVTISGQPATNLVVEILDDDFVVVESL